MYRGYNEKSKERTMKYMKEKRDRITVGVPKGDKQRYTEYAQGKGMSLNRLIVTLLEEDMKKGL